MPYDSRFTIPRLPKEFYDRMQAMRVHYELTQWQAILVGQAAVAELAGSGPETLGRIVQYVKMKYPHVYTAPGQPRKPSKPPEDIWGHNQDAQAPPNEDFDTRD